MSNPYEVREALRLGAQACELEASRARWRSMSGGTDYEEYIERMQNAARVLRDILIHDAGDQE